MTASVGRARWLRGAVLAITVFACGCSSHRPPVAHHARARRSTQSASQATSTTKAPTGPAPGISGIPPSPVKAGVPYQFAFLVTGIPAPSTRVTTGSLPLGLTLSGLGVLTGTPSTPGIYTATITAANAVPPEAIETVTIIVASGLGPTGGLPGDSILAATPGGGPLGNPVLTITPDRGPPGTAVSVAGAGYQPGESVSFVKYRTSLAPQGIPPSSFVCSAAVAPDGTFTCAGNIPTGADAGDPGTHGIVARGDTSLVKLRTTFTLT